jgi:P-type Cu+ transporter
MAKVGADAAEYYETVGRLAEEGKTAFHVAVDGRLAAVFAVADPIKPTAIEAVRSLHALGVRVAMITGDDRRTAEAVGRQLRIDDIVAEVTPAGKLEALRGRRERGGIVAFVGDGLNDAPALAEADIGIAIGAGTDVAIEAAEVVLAAADLRSVARAIAISRATLRNIKQNLFWAFAYNVALIPVAAGVLYPATGLLRSPMLAAAAMALSSVFVVSNALRLRSFGRARGSGVRRRPGGALEAAAAE